MVLRPGRKTRALKGWLRSLAPVLLFASVLVFMQWISGMPVTSLALKTVLVFLVATALIRFLPWTRWILAARPGSFFYMLVLFGLFVRHFVAILTAESRRVLTARSMLISKSCGPGAFRSLACAVSSLFGRALARAERFYAAQSLRGIAE